MANLLQFISLLLLQPDYATHDLYDSPRLSESFLIVTLYAGLSALNSFISVLFTTQTIGGGILLAMLSAFLVYLTWIFLSIIFHFASEIFGGLGEFLHALGFVGISAAPLLLISVISILLTILGTFVFSQDPNLIVSKIRFFFSIIGMAWGWPGVLCYFGMKNAERVKPLVVLLVTVVVCAGFITYEMLTSEAW